MQFELEMDCMMVKVGDLPDVEAEPVSSRRPECNQKIHRRDTGSQRLPRGNIEAPSEPELDQACERKLSRWRRHQIEAERHACHAEQKRGNKHHSHYCQSERLGRAFLCSFSGLAHARTLSDESRAIADIIDSCDQIGRVHRGFRHLDPRRLGREIDIGFQDASDGTQGFFNPADAGGACHAVNIEVDHFVAWHEGRSFRVFLRHHARRCSDFPVKGGAYADMALNAGDFQL